MRIGRIQNNYTKDGFEGVKDMGLEFIEICCNYDKDIERLLSSESEIIENVKRTGIDISSIGRWNHEIYSGGVLLPEKKKLYFELLDTAKRIGAHTFVCGCNYDESISLYKNYSTAIALFSELIEHAEGKIKIAVENCHWNNFVISPREWEVVLGELPELCLKYDPSHAYNRDADYLSEMSDWGERIAHFHVKGTVHAGARKVSDPPAGMDDIRWGSVFAVLYDRGYDGDLSIEPHSAAWQGVRADRGVEFTRDYIKQFVI